MSKYPVEDGDGMVIVNIQSEFIFTSYGESLNAVNSGNLVSILLCWIEENGVCIVDIELNGPPDKYTPLMPIKLLPITTIFFDIPIVVNIGLTSVGLGRP